MKRLLLSCLTVLILMSAALAQPATWQPALPRVGDVVTISYNPRLGTISPTTATLWLHWGAYNPETQAWTTPPQAIWPAGSRLHTDNVAVQSPMTRGTDSIWTVTIDFDTSVHDIAFVFTDGASAWDNNSNNNWTISFVTPGTVSWWTPEDPEPGDVVTLFYDARPGTLPDNSTAVTLHWGVNETSHGAWQLPPQSIWPAGTVAQGQAAQTPLVSLGGGLFQLVIHTTDSIRSIHYVFTNGTAWDNNNNLNWDIFLTPPVIPLSTHKIFRYDPRSAFANAVPGQITSVNLAGTFNNWSTSATPLTNLDPYGNRWAEVLLPVGTTNYKFVINGSNWQIDPDNPRNNPNDNNNSMITAVADSFPQVYDVQPGDTVFAAGTTNAVISVKVRKGDAGPGLFSAPAAWVNGLAWPAAWNAATGQLTLNALPVSSRLAYDVAISAADSAGRSRTTRLAYGMRNAEGFMAVDPRKDTRYLGGQPQDSSFDLLGVTLDEFSNGDSIVIYVGFARLDPNRTLAMLTISSALDGFAPIPGFASELNVPNLAGGGISLPLLDPASPSFVANVHNRIHPYGDLAQTGPEVRYLRGAHSMMVSLAKADLEAYLGSYQTAWYYTCASYKAAGAADGYCAEVDAADGGIAGTEEPDAHDVLFFFAADVQDKLYSNYGLTRRTTLDAAGRGVAAITPQEIGPHIASAGPVCRILTRGAPTMSGTQTIVARITSTPAISQVWLMQNSTRLNATMAGDSFVLATTLVEGENRFVAYATDANGDTGRSSITTFIYTVNHTPTARISARLFNGNCILDGTSSTDPEAQTLTYTWTADADNPAPVTLSDPHAVVAQFTPPTVRGEYYFTLTATDPDNHSGTARTFFSVTDSVHGFRTNESADWVNNAIIYEIFVRSYSQSGNLDGVTADMQRIADLGVNCIWLMPIFEGPSDHGYEITDYYHIEQDYGTEQDLRELIAAAHARGIRIVLDMVLNHTGIGHPFMQDAIRHGRYSHYWNWYDRDANGNYTYYYDWTSLPNINLNNPETVQYYIDMCAYWIREFDVDGYRCDVAWGPQQRSPQFWVQWRDALKRLKPDCLLLAEATAADHSIFDNRFDLAFDWNLHHEGSSSFANMFPQIPGFTNLTELTTNYNVWWPPYKQPLRFMENHDETRFISQNTAPQTKLVSSFMMSMPGDVMLYAGQEVGTTSQRGLPTWNSDPNGMYPHYYRLTNARKLLPAMRTGAFTLVTNNQSGSCYSFARYGAGMDPVVWAGNFTPTSQVVTVNVTAAALGLSADSNYVVSDILTGISFNSTGAQLASMTTSLGAHQSRVWVISDHAISVDAPRERPALPQKIQLGAAYPNPFNPTTVLPLELNQATLVSLKVYDLLGREVATIADEILEAGAHRLTWDGRSCGSGIYFAVLRAGSTHQVQKLLLVR